MLFFGSGPIDQGSPTGPRTVTGAQPVTNQAARQEVGAIEGAKLHRPLTIAPHRSHYRLNHPCPRPPPPTSLGKNCLPRNPSLVPKRLGTAAVDNLKFSGSPVLLAYYDPENVFPCFFFPYLELHYYNYSI